MRYVVGILKPFILGSVTWFTGLLCICVDSELILVVMEAISAVKPLCDVMMTSFDVPLKSSDLFVGDLFGCHVWSNPN